MYLGSTPISSAGTVLPSPVREAFFLPAVPTGNAGSLSLSAGKIELDRFGQIGVENSGTGDAGELRLDGEILNIDNEGLINASALFGNGGNIIINSDRIQLSNGDISTSANLDGGNITVNADTLLAIGDSDITATAINGNGGDIIVNAEGILGLVEQSAEPNNSISEVDASSQFGIAGTITITSPDTSSKDPLIAISQPKLNRIAQKLITSCESGGREEPLLSDNRNDGWRESPEEYRDITLEEVLEETVWKPGDPITRGEVAVTTPQGRTFLISRSQLEELEQKGCSIEEKLNS